MKNSASLTIDELTWLSASTLIENHYALVETPSSEQDVPALLQAAFPETNSGGAMEVQIEDERSGNRLHLDDSPLHTRSTLPTMSTRPRANLHTGMTYSTPGSGSPTRPITRGTAGTAASLQFHRNPMTPPHTPPQQSKYPSHDYSAARPPSPSLSTSTLSSSGNSRPLQTEWIYRRPKSSSPANNALLTRHRSASASCASPSRSPSLSYTQHRSSKSRQHHTHAIPRPSSPVLISSTSQLVETASHDPSVCSSVNGLSRAASASVSSLQLQSSIRVSPLKNRTPGSSASSLPSPDPNGFAAPPSIERYPSNTSTSTSISTGTAIWSALRAKSSGHTSERSRALKSVPSQSQTTTDLPVTPTFVAPSSAPLPISTASLLPPRTPPKDRFLSGTPLPQQRDKDRLRQRRDKFASAPPIPILGPGAASPPSSLMTTSTSPASPSGASSSTIRTYKNRNPRGRTPSLTSECSITTSTTTHTSVTTNTVSSSSSSRSHPDTPPTPLSIPGGVSVHAPEIYNYGSVNSPPAYLHGLDKPHHTSGSIVGGITTAAARSQAYAQLTARLRRPSTSPSGSPVRSFVKPRSQGSWRGYGGGESPTAPVPFSTSHPPPPPPPALSQRAASSRSFSYALSPPTPHTSHTVLPKTKSILTRTSSMSTKGSQCGSATKTVKFVEIPEVHYRSGCYEDDEEGNEHDYGNTYGGGNHVPDVYHDDDDEEDGCVGVGARGEGQEGIVLRECMGIDVEAIDMDIDTYLGIGSQEESKEVKLSFRRKQGNGFSVGKFLSIGSKKEKEKLKEKEDDSGNKESVAPTQGKEPSTSLRLKRFMGLATRKTVPPALSISITSPIPFGTKPTTTTEDNDTTTASKKRTTSPPVSPIPANKPTISGPYMLGSCPPYTSSSRSSSIHTPLPSPSALQLQHSISSRSNPMSSSNTSLNRLNSLNRRQYNPRYQDTTFGSSPRSRPHSIRGHRTNLSGSSANGSDVSTQRFVGSNLAGTRPKGIIGSDVASLNVLPIPLTSSPSYESFRSTKSYGNRSMRSIDAGSIKSAGVESIRTFKAWIGSRVGTGVSGIGSPNVSVAVAE